jgi:hypothetical protein
MFLGWYSAAAPSRPSAEIAIEEHGARGIDDRDLGLGRRAVFETSAQGGKIGIDVCRINPFAIGRECKIARAAPRQQTLFLRACLRIQNGNVAGDTVRYIDILACRILNHAGGFCPHAPCGSDGKRASIDHRNRVVPGVRD